jgi:cytochrome c-type biogenesis protein CcmF
MVLNSLVLFFYRVRNHDKRDHVVILSWIIGLVVLTVFLFSLYSLNPFSLEKHPLFPFFPEGSGLSEILLSPFMIWHPFFTFVAYAIFLIPFSIVIAEVLLEIINKYFPRIKGEDALSVQLKNSYQRTFNDFALKFGWLVSSLSIGFGAYWAKIALNWGRYWGWDPVETVSLVPWFFITAYFHTVIFKKKNPILIKINTSLIFFSVLFSTLITRTGNLSPLHSFAGGAELLIWVVIVGLILVCLSLYVIYIVLDYLMEEYRKKKLFFDYLSYIFLFGLAFVCIFGLFIPPFTSYLSNYFPIDTIYIGPEYFIITTSILAVGLAITLIFCSLWEYFKIKWIALSVVVGISILSVFSFSLLFILGIWINPLLIIFFMSILASLFKLTNNFNVKKGVKYFFRLNSKTIIHAGISFILTGFLIDPILELSQDIFFITGFIFLIIGIVPSILTVFFAKGESE